jgi:hypothetical protein
VHTNVTAEPEQFFRFVRASHSDGDPHQVVVRGFDLRPLSCSCRAGQYGRICHAVLSVVADELEPLAKQRWQEACGETDIREAARVYGQVKRWARAARELTALRSCGYVPARRAQEVVA